MGQLSWHPRATAALVSGLRVARGPRPRYGLAVQSRSFIPAARKAVAGNEAPPLDPASWCAVYVNLARRPDRRSQLAQTLAPGNSVLLSKLARIDAVDGQLLDLADARLRRFVSSAALQRAEAAKSSGAFTIVHQEGQLVKFHDHLTTGGIACAMSHHAALAAVANHPTADWGLIMEDDVTALQPRVHESLARLLQRLPADWDALFLGYHGGVLAGTGAGSKDTAEEEARAKLELQLEEMRGPDGNIYMSTVYCTCRMYGTCRDRSTYNLQGVQSILVTC